ncbi:hypothetical protein OG895_18875 [Streptomyces sp. NBC_00201]|nr:MULTISPECIES: hypothetical protein [unclassified Streptomyces]MCX5247247.1 hypothetical protein [Streptomyces sp. NBC_00201]MCX5286991.1 hypothetical protein [Streptomyces sp. NBC_00183]
MPTDPYAVLRALLRAEAARSAPKPTTKKPEPKQTQEERDR